MNYEEAYEKVKSLFTKNEPVVEVVEVVVEMKDTKLEDGTIVRYDKLEVGGVLEVINEDGTTTVLSDGEYTIDGMVVMVSNGSIIETKPVEDVPVEEAEVEIETEPEVPETETPDLKVLEERISKLEEMISMITEGMTEVKQSQIEKIEQLQTKLSEMEMTPAVESVTKIAKVETSVNKFDILSSAIDGMKKNK